MIVETLSAIGRAAAEQVNLAAFLGHTGMLVPEATDENQLAERQQWASIHLDSAEAIALSARAEAHRHALAGELADLTRELVLVRHALTLDAA